MKTLDAPSEILIIKGLSLEITEKMVSLKLDVIINLTD